MGYLDKISAPEQQRELDELLLHTSNFSADSNEDPQDDDEDIVIQTPTVGPIAPSRTHERNISTPTPGTRQSPCLIAKENVTIQSLVSKPHLLSDIDPFDRLLDNHDHIDEILSDPEIISVIQHHLMAIVDTVHMTTMQR